jgi:hypothetical protein
MSMSDDSEEKRNGKTQDIGRAQESEEEDADGELNMHKAGPARMKVTS